MQVDRLRVYSINKIAAIKSRQNVQIKKLQQKNKKATQHIPHVQPDLDPVTQPATSIKKSEQDSKLDSVPKKSKMLSDKSNELNFTNARSGLTVTSTKKNRSKSSKKNLFAIEEPEHDDHH